MKKRGFTLIEMLIVIVIIGILAGALIPRIGGARDKANDVAREANVKSIATALTQFNLDNGIYPTNEAGLSEENIYQSRYGIASAGLDGSPTEADTYGYKALDSNLHFAVCIELSDGSTAGNYDTDITSDDTITTFTAALDAESGNGQFYCQVF